MNQDKKDLCGDIFTHRALYSSLSIEIISNSLHLLNINFLEKKNKSVAEIFIPEPVKKALSFLDDYFRGIVPSVDIQFSTGKNYNCGTNSEIIILDMIDFSEKEISIYSELVKVKSGNKISYGELASRSGVPRGARFAGNCMAKNRFPIIIPCHRVIKSDGSLGNYSGGVDIKIMLLDHEAKR